MSNLVNLLRDQTHMQFGQTPIAWSSFSTGIGNGTYMNSDSVVYDTKGTVHSPIGTAGNIAATQWRGVGLLISPPNVDATPYRIKGAVVAENAVAYAFVGFAPKITYRNE